MSTRARLNVALDRMEFADRDDVILLGAGENATDTSEGGVSNRTMDLAEQVDKAERENAPEYRIKLLKEALKKSKAKDQKAEDARKRRNRNKRLDDYTNWTGWGTLNVPKPGIVYVNTPTLPYGTGFA